MVVSGPNQTSVTGEDVIVCGAVLLDGGGLIVIVMPERT